MVNQRDDEFAQHLNPIYRSRANFLIMADIAEEGFKKRWEQIWAEKKGENLFSVCCIPIFAYNLALEDIVRTAPKLESGLQYVIDEVVTPSGNYTFRVYAGRRAGR